jgi:hypothetical protein
VPSKHQKSSQPPAIRTLRVDKVFQRFPSTGGMLFGYRLESGEWLKCIGTLPAEIDEGDDLIVVGATKQHPKYGEQFNIQFVVASGIGPLQIDERKIVQIMALRELEHSLMSGHCYDMVHTLATKLSSMLGQSYEDVVARLSEPLDLVVVHGKRILKHDIDAAETTIATAIRSAIHHT